MEYWTARTSDRNDASWPQSDDSGSDTALCNVYGVSMLEEVLTNRYANNGV